MISAQPGICEKKHRFCFKKQEEKHKERSFKLMQRDAT
jgi:hypothetical protein